MGVSFTSLFSAFFFFFKAPLGKGGGKKKKTREKGPCIVSVVSVCVQHAKHGPKFLIS